VPMFKVACGGRNLILPAEFGGEMLRAYRAREGLRRPATIIEMGAPGRRFKFRPWLLFAHSDAHRA